VSFEGVAKAVGGDPRGGDVLRVLRDAELLQGFPTLLHFAMQLLFTEGICLVLLRSCAEVLQDFPAFLQFAPPLRNMLFAEVKRVACVRGVRRGGEEREVEYQCVCVFYYCRTYYKAVRVGGGGEWRTCAMRDDEPRPVWMSLLITH
jgi:hypothetical protein